MQTTVGWGSLAVLLCRAGAGPYSACSGRMGRAVEGYGVDIAERGVTEVQARVSSRDLLPDWQGLPAATMMFDEVLQMTEHMLKQQDTAVPGRQTELNCLHRRRLTQVV